MAAGAADVHDRRGRQPGEAERLVRGAGDPHQVSHRDVGDGGAREDEDALGGQRVGVGCRILDEEPAQLRRALEVAGDHALHADLRAAEGSEAPGPCTALIS